MDTKLPLPIRIGEVQFLVFIITRLDLFLKYPVVFIRFSTQVDEITTHLHGSLGHLGQVSVFEIEISDGIFHFGI